MATKQQARPAQDKGKGKATSGKASDSLNFSSQSLPDGPPPSSFHPGLYKLTLSSCDLRTLTFLSQAPRLSLLNLSGNRELGKLTDEAWTEALGGLEGLCVLNLAKCGLKRVPRVVKKLQKLKALVVSENELERLDEVKDLPELNTLVVSHNHLVKLPKTLASLRSLKKLSASHNRLSPAVLPDLSSLPSLREVRLTGNPDIDRLPDHFSRWGTAEGGKGIEILELGGCGLRDIKALKGLSGMGELHHLSLKGNPFAASIEDDFETFKQKVTQLVPSLRILDGHRFDPKFVERTQRIARKDGPATAADPPARSSAKPKRTEREPPAAEDRPTKNAKRRRTDDDAPVDRAAARMLAAAADAEADDDDEAEELETAPPTAAAPRKKRKKRDAEPGKGTLAPAEVDGKTSQSEVTKPKPRSDGPPKKKRSRHNKRILRESGQAPPSTSAPNDASLETVQATNPTLYGASGLSASTTKDSREEKGAEKEGQRKEKARTSVVKVIDVGSGKSGKGVRGAVKEKEKEDALALMLGGGGATTATVGGWD